MGFRVYHKIIEINIKMNNMKNTEKFFTGSGKRNVIKFFDIAKILTTFSILNFLL